ncbi:glycosyltransferase family 2 protein [Pseudobacter ginsenosidimutans]|uniref:Glycosyl transferase family 2 n=1 Tax=Pseudobacter ginsenosidimutans TaxID=661488 RepID=A0A4Q7N108_9BACT|nr:glycosyltransferase [Pseudobacter ginsenosidimutans]QEC43864.1 glycosyltransferase [Pseudobacter ginsenosidimutans]RZS75290.1 glycosyl transferase family 2 [Pseudobacter ginsenosidimutans]
MPRFSIILPVRNGGEYAKECVNSILSQTLNDFNLVVLDNCSTDRTVEWLESLHDERIVIHKADRSLSIEENWARIKDVSRNEFMTMIGHDDLLLPNYLEEMQSIINRFPNATLYQTHFNYINATGGLIRPCLPMDEQQYVQDFLAAQMQRKIDSTGTGYMMRSSQYDEVGGIPPNYPNLIFADFALWVRLMAKGYKITSSKNCFSYRVHQSVSATTNAEAFMKAFGIYAKEIDLLQQKDPAVQQAVRSYGREFLLLWCESLSHRLLKTPLNKRSMLVSDLMKKFMEFAGELIPGQSFEPGAVFRIKLAEWLDSNTLTRNLFQWYKK